MNRYANPELMKQVEVDMSQRLEGKDTEGQKWFKDEHGVEHYVTPDGGIYNEHGTLLGGTDESRFTNPDLMQKMDVSSVNLDQHHPEYDTADQKWFTDSNGNWTYVTPEGGVYDQHGTLVGGVDHHYFHDTTDLIQKH